MKQTLRSLVLTLLISFSISFASKSQVAVNASIGSDFVIHLNENTPLVSDYTFDISSMNFDSKEESEHFFSMCRDNLLNYSVNYDAKTASVHISLEYMEPRGWGINEYIGYFQKVSERYRKTYEAISE